MPFISCASAFICSRVSSPCALFTCSTNTIAVTIRGERTACNREENSGRLGAIAWKVSGSPLLPEASSRGGRAGDEGKSCFPLDNSDFVQVDLPSSQRQVKRHRSANAGREAVVFIKRLRFWTLGIDDQRKRGDLLAGLQAAFHCAANELLTQSPASVVRAACQTPQSKARYGIARPLLPVRVFQFHPQFRYFHLGSTERVTERRKRRQFRRIPLTW